MVQKPICDFSAAAQRVGCAGLSDLWGVGVSEPTPGLTDVGHGRPNRLETRLIKAVEAGRSFTYDPSELRPDDCIRGSFIRSLLLGLELRHSRNPAFPRWKPIEVTPHGIRISRDPAATGDRLLPIEGDLDLNGLAAPGGGVLPLLELSDSDFRGAFTLAGARVQALILSGSRFRHLDASGAHFAGSVSFRDCRPRSDPVSPAEAFFERHDLAALDNGRSGKERVSHCYTDRHGRVAGEAKSPPAGVKAGATADREASRCCTVNMQFATVEGGLVIEGCYFRAAGIVGRKSGVSKLHDSLAINLSRARIERSVLIRQTTVIGFVKASSIDVGQDVAVRGGKFLVSSTTAAFDFQLARIGGKLSLQEGRPTDDERQAGVRSYPLVVLGQIWGVGLTAGEVWIGEGLYYGADEKGLGDRPTLYFSKTNVRSTFKIGAYHEFHAADPARPTAGAMVQGEICLLAANLGKNLEIHGLTSAGIRDVLRLDHPFFQAFACGARREEFVRLTGTGLRVDRRAVITGADLKDFTRADLPLPVRRTPGTKPGALDLWKSKIGIGLRISRSCTLVGALKLNSCVIGREVIIDCKEMKPSPRPEGVEGRDVIPWLLDLRETTIDGQLKIGRKRSQSEREAGDDRSLLIHGGISLENARVHGRAQLRRLRLNLSQCPSKPDLTGKRDIRYRIALNMRDFECSSDLEIHNLEWTLPAASPDDYPARPRFKWYQLRARLGAWMPRGFENILTGWFAVLDLRGLKCGLLMDDFGDAWGLNYRLWMLVAGIRVGETEAGGEEAARRRLKWLAFQSRLQAQSSHCIGTAAPARRNPGLVALPGWLWTMFKGWCWSLWCAFWAARRRDFVPQAYDAFSAVSRRAGDKEAAPPRRSRSGFPTAKSLPTSESTIPRGSTKESSQGRWASPNGSELARLGGKGAAPWGAAPFRHPLPLLAFPHGGWIPRGGAWTRIVRRG